MSTGSLPNPTTPETREAAHFEFEHYLQKQNKTQAHTSATTVFSSADLHALVKALTLKGGFVFPPQNRYSEYFPTVFYFLCLLISALLQFCNISKFPPVFES